MVWNIFLSISGPPSNIPCSVSRWTSQNIRFLAWSMAKIAMFQVKSLCSRTNSGRFRTGNRFSFSHCFPAGPPCRARLKFWKFSELFSKFQNFHFSNWFFEEKFFGKKSCRKKFRQLFFSKNFSSKNQFEKWKFWNFEKSSENFQNFVNFFFDRIFFRRKIFRSKNFRYVFRSQICPRIQKSHLENYSMKTTLPKHQNLPECILYSFFWWSLHNIVKLRIHACTYRNNSLKSNTWPILKLAKNSLKSNTSYWFFKRILARRGRIFFCFAALK